MIFHTKRLFAVSFSFSLRHLLNGAGISDRTDIGAFHDMWHYSTESSVYPSLVYHDSHHIFIQFDRYVQCGYMTIKSNARQTNVWESSVR